MAEQVVPGANHNQIDPVIIEFAFTVSGKRSRNLNRLDRFSNIKRLSRSVRRYAIRHPIQVYFIVGLLSLSTIYVLDEHGRSGVSINATTYIAAVGLSIGAYQAWLLSLVSQAKFINDALAKFVEKPDLFSAWFDLFYTYNDDIFNEIDDIVKSKDVYVSAKLEEINKGHVVGCRYWHPDLLPRTPEEARIDALLGYFSVLGDMYERGNLSVSEIGDIAEYYLMTLAKSRAFVAYLTAIRVAFRGEKPDGSWDPNSPYRRKYGSPPFRHLCFLLVELHAHVDLKEEEVYGRFKCITKKLSGA